MDQKFRILLLEDSKTDAEIIQRFLLREKLPCEFRLATNEKAFIAALDDFSPRVILSDNSMPGFSAIEALEITRRRNQYIPFIMVTGTVSEEFAASIIKLGADDYILKDRMSRLPAAIEAALKQRKAEKQIADYQYALDHGYIVAITDQKGTIQYANDNFCKISGYQAKELIGKNYRIVYAGQPQESNIDNLRSAIFNGRIWKGEFCNKAKDNGLYWVDATIVPFLNEKNIPYQYMVMCTNITERKRIEAELQKSNERFKYATIASSDIIWELNYETGEYIVHEGREKLFAADTVLDWQTGRDGLNIVAEDRERVISNFHEAEINPASNLWKEEYRIYSVNNSVWHISNHAIFIRNDSGKTIKAIGAITDITENKKLEAELFEQHTNEQFKITATALDAQEKERNAIGSELHDNVNQILLGTKLLLSVINDDPASNRMLMATCIEHLQHAIDENRKLAHALVIPDFQSIHLTDQLYNLAESMLKTPGIDADINTTHFHEELIPEGYKLPVYRIAQEQCSNIVKYAAAHTVNIVLSTASDVFKMIISDDGIGMDIAKKTDGIGIKNIKGRLSILKGAANIITAPGQGFTLEIVIPLNTETSAGA